MGTPRGRDGTIDVPRLQERAAHYAHKAGACDVTVKQLQELLSDDVGGAVLAMSEELLHSLLVTDLYKVKVGILVYCMCEKRACMLLYDCNWSLARCVLMPQEERSLVQILMLVHVAGIFCMDLSAAKCVPLYMSVRFCCS
jgi:hypothetical protein